MINFTIFYLLENPSRGRQARNFTSNVPKILDLKSSSAKIKYVDNKENDFDVQPRGSANRRDKRQEVNLHVKPNL